MDNQSFKVFSSDLISKLLYYSKISIISIFLTISLTGSIILAYPAVYLTETINAEFDHNGTLINRENLGYIEVELFNTEDVLQNIEISLSSATGTNLASSETYAAVAASPSSGDRTRMYLDTDEGNGTIYYKFNDATIVNININYWNEAGGKDLTPENNTIYFEVFLNASETLNNIKFNLNANKNTLGASDSMNILAVGADSGTVFLIDSDLDGFNDIVQWNGNLNTNTRINFTGEIIPDINYPRDYLRVDIDSHESSLNYSQSITFTGITLSNRFARGAIRQGLRIMAKETNWTIMGFIKNIASSTIYNVTNWNIYKVLDNGSLENTSVLSNSTGKLLYPGNLTTTPVFNCYDKYTLCTGIYDTGIIINSSEKATSPNIYYAPSFNWSIEWGLSNYLGIIDEKVNLPTFYQMDAGLDKRINLIYNDKNGRLLSIEDEIKHLGHATLQLSNISINITGLNGWANSTPEIFYVNNTNETKITDYACARINNTFIINISSITSEKIQVNDFILIKYNLSRSTENSDKTYNFGLNAIVTTKSGTPVKKNLSGDINIYGFKKEDDQKDGGGGGGAISPETKNFIDILKIESTSKFITTSLIKNEISFKILDTGTKGIRDPMFFIYLPGNSNIYSDQVNVFLLRDNKKEKLNVEVKKTGNKTIGSKNYTEYLVQKITGSTETFILHDKDIIIIDYRAYIPLGTSEIITRLYGYNYYDDIHMFEDAITKVRREYWRLQNLDIKESKFENNKIFVGKPVKWIKTIEIYNPNERSVKEIYTTKILSDRLNSKIKESKNGSTYDIPIENEEKDSLDFLIDIKAKERITYFILVNTPPILEIKREISILKITNNSVKLNLKIQLKNLAEYDYREIYFRLPIQNILNCNFNFSYFENQTEIKIPRINSTEELIVDIFYEEKPPILKIYIDKSEYNNEEIMNLTVIVVQAEKKGYLELEITGPGNNRNTVYADLIHLDKISKKMNIELLLDKYLEGDYIISAYYKSNFQQILIEKLDLSISGEEYNEMPWSIFFILTILIIGFVYKKRYKRKTLEEKLNDLKSKL